jgi:hypothetical protein
MSKFTDDDKLLLETVNGYIAQNVDWREYYALLAEVWLDLKIFHNE